ncbi:MAG: four helix bundle protein [Acidobacteria bacterium]|nr:four helix bundle protein [Acidobacteriota bacterium]
MDRIKDFRDLVAWKLARELKLLAQALCARPALKRQFQFRDQLSSAAESAPANIAEGFGRYYHPDCARFARIARRDAELRQTLGTRQAHPRHLRHRRVSKLSASVCRRVSPGRRTSRPLPSPSPTASDGHGW